ncbi:Cell division protein FtsA [Lentibacillus sp. JNUCC-1]|nr:Cell division protein FtsA [Lentibacillus sp. JNUCC-1]
MIGVRLEMEGTIITCSKTALHNTLRCVERAGLSITDICLQPLAAGTVALSKDEKNLGVALIDIGGGCTSVSVFENDHLAATSVTPLGGNNITKDVSIGLRTSTEEAEDVKLNHGHAFYDEAREDETFEIMVIGSNNRETHHQLEIADMIEARLEEIYVFAAQEIQRMGYRHLPGGFVLTGGTMKMAGVQSLAEDVLQTNVRIAIPDYIGVREPQYTAGVGILQFAYHNAKIQGKELSEAVAMPAAENQQTKQSKRKRTKQADKPKTKEKSFANLFKYFLINSDHHLACDFATIGGKKICWSLKQIQINWRR